MASDFIGVVRDAHTGQVMAVINPDDDSQLDNPRWLLIRSGETRAVELIRVPRADYMSVMSLDQLAEFLDRFK